MKTILLILLIIFILWMLEHTLNAQFQASTTASYIQSQSGTGTTAEQPSSTHLSYTPKSSGNVITDLLTKIGLSTVYQAAKGFVEDLTAVITGSPFEAVERQDRLLYGASDAYSLAMAPVDAAWQQNNNTMFQTGMIEGASAFPPSSGNTGYWHKTADGDWIVVQTGVGTWNAARGTMETIQV